MKSLYGRLPLALKPAIKENFFYATGAKAWRANTIEELHHYWEKSARQISPGEILIQEIIPGDGREQYSYCAFVRYGQVHSKLTARRLRQHPREFGRAATYVETIDAPEIEELSERFLAAIHYHGIVEIEFKRDPRDGKYKLLDVNARAWGFHALGSVCGVDFPYLLFADRLGLPVEPSSGEPGAGWMRLLTDVPTAISDLLHGSLSLGAYLKSLRATRNRDRCSAGRDPAPLFCGNGLAPVFRDQEVRFIHALESPEIRQALQADFRRCAVVAPRLAKPNAAWVSGSQADYEKATLPFRALAS